MAENDKRDETQDLRDIQVEESSRGRKQPPNAVSLEGERKIRLAAKCNRLAQMQSLFLRSTFSTCMRFSTGVSD